MSLLITVILAAALSGSLEQTVVSPAWLQAHLEDPDVILVEVGSSPTVDHPHIPGARFLSIESILSREGWPPDELPPVSELRQAFENAGVGDEGRIILYSANPLYATRAWFTLDTLGHGERAAILDGGLDRWIAEKRALSNRRRPHLAKTFTPHPVPERVASLAETRAAMQSGVVLIDARNANEFHGFRRGEKVVRRGHIPGAKCNAWQSNVTRNGSFRTQTELEKSYAELVGQPGTRVIVYCRTGMSASMPYFVLRSLGYDVALFDGSYTEWAREKTNAVQFLGRRR